jgi:four helix bundle protein
LQLIVVADGRLMIVKSFEDLEVWRLAKDLTIKTYRIVTTFPKDEVFGLASQIKRAALSVPANIAEGFGRFHYPDKTKFYLNARGSLLELKNHLLIANDLQFVSKADLNTMIQEIDQLGIKINNLIQVTRKQNLKANAAK